jgi:hypothetical protein
MGGYGGPIPNPQSPIPNPQSPFFCQNITIKLNNNYQFKLYKKKALIKYY